MDGNTITYRQQYSFCNKPGCRKCRDGIGHGPYWYAYQTVQGRTVRTYIGKILPEGVQGEQDAGPPGSSFSTQITSLAPLFRLTTLGLVRLERRCEDGRWQTIADASWHAPQTRALLCCLVCAPGRELSRQRACELLWPGLDAKSAGQHLRRASAALAQLLGPVYDKQTDNGLTLAGQAQLQVDCESFEDLLAQARAFPVEQRVARIALLEQATKLYGGEFFPEERVADWARPRREILRNQWIAAILNLADLYLDERRVGSAIDLLDQLLTADPANEAAVRRLMFLLARQKRRIEAVQAYQRLTTILQNTHQAAPSPETRSLFHAIQQGQEELARPFAAAASDLDETSALDEEAGMRSTQRGERHPESRSIALDTSVESMPGQAGTNEQKAAGMSIGRANQSPLVGRDLEVAALYRVLAQVEEAQGQRIPASGSAELLLSEERRLSGARCMILMGELGIGKTRLAEESAREARRRGWTVVWSQAYAQEQDIPYRLWTAALRAVLAHAPALARQATEIISAATYRPLRALIPEMQEALVSAGMKEGVNYDALLPEQEELRLREAVFTFLTTLSHTTPLLLVLDDIQWADESSVQMLGYLARRMADHPIVILATCRETELSARGALRGLIAHMQREQVVEVIRVQPLSNEQIGALISLVTPLSEPAIVHIQNQVAGNPFFAEELAYSLRASPAPGETGIPVLPGTIAAVLDRRLDRLSKECLELLGRAAVLGGSFNLPLIAAMGPNSAEDEHDAALDLVDEALRSGVLAEEGEGAHLTFHFWHPLLASHLYHRLSATRRALLHRKIADVLHQLHQSRESEEAATIVRHLIQGGADKARIAHYAELAAHHAYNLLAYSEAERYYYLALKYLAPALLTAQNLGQEDQSPLPTAELEQRLRLAFLCERLAECARVHGNFKDAPAFYLRAIQLRSMPPRTFATQAEECQEAQIQAILWSEIAWIWRFTGDTAAARSCNARGEEVLQKAGITDGPAWGRLRNQQASLYWHEGYHQEAIYAAHQALDLFTACLTTTDSRARAAIPPDRQTRTMLTLQGDPVDLGRAHGFLGIIYSAIGQLSEGLKHLHEALAIYEQYDQRREVAHTCCNIGHIHLLRAEYTQARAFFQRPVSYVEQSGDILKSVLLYNLGELAVVAHRFDEAEKFYREGLALVEEINDREYISNWSAILGAVYQEQGRFREAASVILRALSVGRTVPRNQPCIGFALVALANLRCALVEREQAAQSERGQRALQHAETDLRRALSLRGLDAEKRTQAHLAQAQVARLRGRLSQARQRGLRARADAQKYELRAIQQQCQSLLDQLPAR